MRMLLLAGATAAALSAAASAAPFVFEYTGNPQQFTVPETGSYQIFAMGGSGGTGNARAEAIPGGLAAQVQGTFTLSAGEVLTIIVAGQGGNSHKALGPGGGGGGSFVIGGGQTLLVAGGGGGGGVGGNFPEHRGVTAFGMAASAGGNGDGGVNGTGGQPGSIAGAGGEGGQTDPFSGDGYGGGGGGGFLSPGGCGGFAQVEGCLDPGGGGASYAGGFIGGTGGGGDGGVGGFGGGGGGGGYTGGGGGGAGGSVAGGGGNGGSFNAGTFQAFSTALDSGNGRVIITSLDSLPQPVPAPGSLALLGTGLTGLLALRRRRGPQA